MGILTTQLNDSHDKQIVKQISLRSAGLLTELVENHRAVHQLFWSSPTGICTELGMNASKLFLMGRATLDYILYLLSVEYDKTITETDIEFLRLFNPDVLPEQCGAGFNVIEWCDYFAPCSQYQINQDGTVTININ